MKHLFTVIGVLLFINFIVEFFSEEEPETEYVEVLKAETKVDYTFTYEVNGKILDEEKHLEYAGEASCEEAQKKIVTAGNKKFAAIFIAVSSEGNLVRYKDAREPVFFLTTTCTPAVYEKKEM